MAAGPNRETGEIGEINVKWDLELDINVKERDQWEDEIRSKLRDFEVDTEPGDWGAIADRLPGKKVVFFRRWYYVAAGIAMFFLMSIGYYYLRKAPSGSSEGGGFVPDVLLVADIQEIAEAPSSSSEEGGFVPGISTVSVYANRQIRQISFEKEKTDPAKTVADPALLPVSQKTQLEVKSNDSKEEVLRSLQTLLTRREIFKHKDYIGYLADATPTKSETKKGKRWGIGAGGGSYSVGPNGGGFISDIRLRSSSYEYIGNDGEWYMDAPVKRDDYFNELLANPSNSEYNTTSIPKIGLKHKQPISYGIGVGYALNDRWSLQSGLVYTLLSSEWRTELDYQVKFKQHLHFVGVPLGVSYKIAEWNKLQFYTTAGGMAEWNIAGNIKTNSYSLDGAQLTEKESVQMKETQWSVNARIGATYPVIKFVNAYVEGGANYYFDTKSSIETIRSNKPFHVSLQAGLRFGF